MSLYVCIHTGIRTYDWSAIFIRFYTDCLGLVGKEIEKGRKEEEKKHLAVNSLKYFPEKKCGKIFSLFSDLPGRFEVRFVSRFGVKIRYI